MIVLLSGPLGPLPSVLVSVVVPQVVAVLAAGGGVHAAMAPVGNRSSRADRPANNDINATARLSEWLMHLLGTARTKELSWFGG